MKDVGEESGEELLEGAKDEFEVVVDVLHCQRGQRAGGFLDFHCSTSARNYV